MDGAAFLHDLRDRASAAIDGGLSCLAAAPPFGLRVPSPTHWLRCGSQGGLSPQVWIRSRRLFVPAKTRYVFILHLNRDRIIALLHIRSKNANRYSIRCYEIIYRSIISDTAGHR
jgi:hypothetical protein